MPVFHAYAASEVGANDYAAFEVGAADAAAVLVAVEDWTQSDAVCTPTHMKVQPNKLLLTSSGGLI